MKQYGFNTVPIKGQKDAASCCNPDTPCQLNLCAYHKTALGGRIDSRWLIITAALVVVAAPVVTSNATLLSACTFITTTLLVIGDRRQLATGSLLLAYGPGGSFTSSHEGRSQAPKLAPISRGPAPHEEAEYPKPRQIVVSLIESFMAQKSCSPVEGSV